MEEQQNETELDNKEEEKNQPKLPFKSSNPNRKNKKSNTEKLSHQTWNKSL